MERDIAEHEKVKNIMNIYCRIHLTHTHTPSPPPHKKEEKITIFPYVKKTET